MAKYNKNQSKNNERETQKMILRIKEFNTTVVWEDKQNPQTLSSSTKKKNRHGPN